MSIFNLFRRRKPTQLNVVTRQLPYSRLTLSDWQSSPERVSYAQELFAAPLFRELVGMLSNVRPLQPRGSLDPTTAAVLLGQRIGHDQVVATLLAAATSPPSPPIEIPMDYAADNVMAEWNKQSDVI